jgi:hypothetical protein
MFGSRLSRLADQQVQQRDEIEQRWMEDLRRIRGVYEDSLKSKLEADDTKSEAFVNLTRSRCRTAKSRMWDMLFPADDRNWEIEPTPVPELEESLDDERITGHFSREIDEETGQPRQLTVAEVAQSEIDIIRERSENMEKEIDDQLTEGRYSIVCRDVISDAIDVGTGILKGPYIIGRSRRSWQNVNGVQQLTIIEEKTPTPQRVDYWNFFPDMSARTPEELGFAFERHYMGRAEVAKLKRLPGFIAAEIDALLETDPGDWKQTNKRLTELRALGGITSVIDDKRYEIWEYHGEIEREELIACGCELEEDEFDMPVYNGIVWFSGPFVLKAVINPMDSGDMPYSILNWEKDPTSVFGYGVSWQMENPQSAANAAWRAMLENGGLSSGPQIVIDENAVEPANGQWKLHGKKVWRKKKSGGDIRQAFELFDIPSRQAELQQILDKSIQLADLETNFPSMLWSGPDQAPPTMAQGSATGATIWANSLSTEIRLAVKNFDDDITDPTITRFYDWNMQFNPDDTIKGDYKCKARGSSVLLVKELQAQNLMHLMNFAGHPMFAGWFKPSDLLRKAVQAHQISADEILYTDEEYAHRKKLEQEGQPEEQMTPFEQAKVQLERDKHNVNMEDNALQRQHEIYMAQLNRETQMMKLSADNNIALEEINLALQQIAISNKKIDTDRQNKVDEMTLKIETGMQGI